MNKSRYKRQQRRLEKEKASREELKVQETRTHEDPSILSHAIRDPSKGNKNIGIVIDPSLQRRLITYCRDTERSQSAAVRYVLRQGLEAEGY